MAPGASASPLTLSRSAVLRKAGSWSCETFTSPAYMNSRIACRWLYATSFRIIIGCLDGFSCQGKNLFSCRVRWLVAILSSNDYHRHVPLIRIWSKDYRRTKPFYELCKSDHRKPMSHPWSFSHLADVWTTTPCSTESHSTWEKTVVALPPLWMLELPYNSCVIVQSENNIAIGYQST